MSSPDSWKSEVRRALEEVRQQLPTQPAKAWDLVRAVGHGRALSGSEPELAVPLQAAERLLESHRPQIVQLLEEDLRVAPLLSGLGSSLEAGLAEEALDRLLALEDVLVVAEVLGFEKHLQHILSEVPRLISRGPSPLADFDALAHQRLNASGSTARSLWRAVLASASPGSSVRLPEVLQTWLEHLDGARALLNRGAAEWAERFGMTHVQLVPKVVLGPAAPAFDVHVEGICPPDWRLRLFIVDALHPRGEPLREGEDYRRADERWVFDGWRLEAPEIPALLIALAAPSLPEHAPLEQLLKADPADVWLTEVLLNPSNVRTP